jgi:hypothetical protein
MRIEKNHTPISRGVAGFLKLTKENCCELSKGDALQDVFNAFRMERRKQLQMCGVQFSLFCLTVMEQHF